MKKILILIVVMLLILSATSVGVSAEESDNDIFSILRNLLAKIFNSDIQSNNQELILEEDDSIFLDEHEFVPGQLIIKFKEDTTLQMTLSADGIVKTGIESVDLLNSEYQVNGYKKIFNDKTISSLSNWYKFFVPESVDILSSIDEYSSDLSVEFAEPNYIDYACYAPNDTYFDQQWALQQMNDCDIDALQAWDIEAGSPNVSIAIIDTGVDYNHSDLGANIWINSGEDLNGNGVVDPSDFNGVDDDNNGVFERGNYFPFKPSERFIIYPDVNLNGGWSVDNIYIRF